jgi:NADH-quinone oxidoreductase subunit J
MADLLTTVVFYLFSAVLLGSGLMVITTKNPVHAVFFLILAFFNAAALFVLIGAEYLAMTLVIVYVGAVAVLFLFVVMMLDINFTEMREGFLRHLPVGAGVAGILLFELLVVFYKSAAAVPEAMQAGEEVSRLTNTQALGNVLYTDYVYAFQLAGLILLVAMVGAIVLTLRQRPGVKRQNIGRQVSRKRKDAVEVVKVASGQGVRGA